MSHSIPELLAALQARGVVLHVHEGRLAVRAPKGVIGPDMKADLSRYRDAILEHLLQQQAVDLPRSGSLAGALRGRRVAVTGATGFLGKVFVARLMQLVPGLGGVELLLRARGRHRGAAARMESQILGSPVFSGVEVAGRARAVEAAFAQPHFGLEEAEFAALAARIDLVVHVAGLVELSPPLSTALEANVEGPRQAIALAEAADAPLLHVSTCYVSGCTAGDVAEELILGRAPRPVPGARFAVAAELHACSAAIAASSARSSDPGLRAELFTAGCLEADLAPAARERARDELHEWATRRANSWGFANVYTYSKALAEQLVAEATAEGRVRASVVRPAILESAIRSPQPGWNQGVNTSAPLVYLARQGHHTIPAAPGRHLDVLPVDMAADAMVAIAAALAEGRAEPVYQLGSGDTNPIAIERLVELTALHYRHHGGLERLVSEPRTAAPRTYERTSAPMISSLAASASAITREAQRRVPDRGLGRGLRGLLGRADRQLEETRKDLREVMALFDAYKVVLDGADATFRTDRTRALIAALEPADRDALGYAPEHIDWRSYWMDVHLPGLERWTLRELEDRPQVEANSDHQRGAPLPPVAESLIALLLDAPAAPDALALGPLTRAEMLTRIAGCADALEQDGVRPGDRVGLLAGGGPDWVLAWFGIVAAGATAVPLDPTLKDAELTELVLRAGCTLLLVSQRERDRRALPTSVALEERTARLGDPGLLGGGRRVSGRPVTLLYTSGTEGRRKGVLLSDLGLSAQVAALASLYGLGPDDHTVSVLPLHHVFQLTCGMLLPLSRGARISFLDEATPTGLAKALSRHRPTAMIAVPAVLDAIWRSVQARIRDLPGAPVVEGLLRTTEWVQDTTELPVGRHLFAAAHQALGGRLRTIVSGGAPLSAATFHGLRSLGLDVYEGYGLSEASPVVCAWAQGSRPLPGQVGPPIPGVEVRLDSCRDGAGEILVRAPGLMLGYDGDAERTAEVLRGGWLHTGDLGRFEGGALRIVGRSKDEIVDNSGHTVHPDELELALQGVEGVAELSVVGIKFGAFEAPAALVRLKDSADRVAVERALRERNARLASWRRVRSFELVDEPLPRGATGKVRRAEVRRLLARDGGTREARQARALVAELLNVPVESLREGASLEELGLDSLARAELGARLGAPASTDLHRLEDVTQRLRRAAPSATEDEPALLPEPLRVFGRGLADGARRLAYDNLLDVEVEGAEHIPWNHNAIIVSNHCSHLDVGLIRQALGDYAAQARSIAAQDYFFDTPLSRFVFTNFSTLLPLDRSAPARGQLDALVEALRGGESLIFFPEGTRAADGQMAVFKSGVGYLALQSGVGILPLYLEGTHAALPKGASMLRSRYLRVRIGPFLDAERLEAERGEGSRRRAYDRVAALAEAAVVALREGRDG